MQGFIADGAARNRNYVHHNVVLPQPLPYLLDYNSTSAILLSKQLLHSCP